MGGIAIDDAAPAERAEGSEEGRNAAEDNESSDDSDPDDLEVGEEGPVRFYNKRNERLIELQDKGRAHFLATDRE